MADVPLMTARELAAAAGGRVVAGDRVDAAFSSVRIDSRAVVPGSLFVALKGEKADGHDFIPKALGSGARVVLASASRAGAYADAADACGAALVAVEDTLRGLQDAAAAYLDKFPRLLRLGITGSAGKTTTKELAAAMIGREKRTVMNEGNLNSETGLPLSVFSVRAEHEVGVFEMGMNRRGEMAELAAVLRPRIALVTNVGTAHIGILGSRDAIAEEKKQIFSRFAGEETALVPEDDPYADFLSRGVRGRVLRYGQRSLAAFGGARALGLDGTEILWAGVPARLALPGAHNLANALAAAAIASEAGASDEAIRAGIESTRALFGRGEILRGEATVVRDCYNANPESALASIAFCDSVEWPGRRVYVIGSMLELGPSSEAEHERVGRALAASAADLVYLFGPETAAAVRPLEAAGKRFVRSDDMGELSRLVAAEAAPGDLFLLKGSRGTALERLADVLPVEGD